ncbi:hypothetical protein FACS1894191_0390 [Clostridia bacterium]|nr:hypothetical protein FACS1894191_0390 [Clostridia bacterium]
MFHITTPEEAVGLIKDGDRIGINAFLALANPEALHDALTEKYSRDRSPGNLRLFCAAGFGMWDKNRYADPYIGAGAVTEIIAGHYASTPEAVRMAAENRLEAYNLPLGVLSHLLRAAASGKDGILSEVGLGTFVDPRVGRCGLNASSAQKLVSLLEIEGREYLYYKAPKIDIAFIKGTTVDPNGNITFEDEFLTVDALSLAQAAKANGGKVIVQVDKVSHIFPRPRNVIVPGILVDAVVVCENSGASRLMPALSGDIHVPSTQMDYYMSKLSASGKRRSTEDASPDIIGERAAAELKAGQIVNIGIGIPERVGKYASERGILRDITATVEAGGIGGLPAPGLAFGATIGADMICDMASQFDFYDGGGLDICFMGGLEADRYGNVNAHDVGRGFVGIGGFINITNATKNIIFCMTFRASGLVTRKNAGKIEIVSEGDIPKFKSGINAVSFSAQSALRRGQRVLYVTERCIFELTAGGLRLAEVFDGIDAERDIKALLDFELRE